MLLHSPTKGHIICFCEAPQWMEQKNRVFVTHLKKASACVSHKQGVPIVYRIAKLKSKYCISIASGKLFTQLCRRKAVLIKTIIVLDWFYNLQVPTNQPITSIGNRLLYIRQSRSSCSPSPCYSFFLIVLVDLNAEKRDSVKA
jgi:hypothetical protein